MDSKMIEFASMTDRRANPLISLPGAKSQQQNENSVQYIFYLLFVRTSTKFGIKLLDLKFNDI